MATELPKWVSDIYDVAPQVLELVRDGLARRMTVIIHIGDDGRPSKGELKRSSPANGLATDPAARDLLRRFVKPGRAGGLTIHSRGEGVAGYEVTETRRLT